VKSRGVGGGTKREWGGEMAGRREIGVLKGTGEGAQEGAKGLAGGGGGGCGRVIDERKRVKVVVGADAKGELGGGDGG